MNRLYAAILLISIGSLVSCGDDSTDVNTRVVNSSLSEKILNIGRGTVLTLGLEYQGNGNLPFSGSDDISLVVKVPRGLRYREGTAEIQRTIDDKGVNPDIVNCGADAEQYLNFRLDGDDLSSGSNPSGTADVEVTLTLEAMSAAGIVQIEAAADKDLPLFGCGSFFARDVEETVQVLR